MPSPLRRRRIRALSVISFCIILVAVVAVWPSRQQANEPTRTTSYQASSLVVSGKGSITPEASTITVNSLSDVANGTDGVCTLREAITSANNNTASGAAAGECPAGSGSVSDTISFSVTGTINLTAALPNITSNLSINGPGSGQLTLRRDTGGDYRIFNVRLFPRASPARLATSLCLCGWELDVAARCLSKPVLGEITLIL